MSSLKTYGSWYSSSSVAYVNENSMTLREWCDVLLVDMLLAETAQCVLSVRVDFVDDVVVEAHVDIAQGKRISLPMPNRVRGCSEMHGEE
jgi:hypothetical protein